MWMVEMEEQKECDTAENHIHRIYFVKIRPSHEEVEKDEAEKQYQLMTLSLARFRISEEMAHQKAVEHEINERIMWYARLDERIERKMQEIKNLQQRDRSVVRCDTLIASVKITNGFFQLSGTVTDARTPVRPDRKRFQKRLIVKGGIDVEYLKQVQEELLTSKKASGKTSCGTRELNDLIESMAHRIQHGNENRAHEMKIYQEIKNAEETRELYNIPEPDPYSQWNSKLKGRNSKRDIDWKRAAQHRINIRLDDIEKIKRHQMGRKSAVTRLKANLQIVRKKISSLNKELENITSKRIEAYKRGNKLGDQTKDLQSCYKEYQSLMTYAKELARKGDVVGLKQLRDTQVDGFMRQWNENKGFRDDYERRKLLKRK